MPSGAVQSGLSLRTEWRTHPADLLSRATVTRTRAASGCSAGSAPRLHPQRIAGAPRGLPSARAHFDFNAVLSRWSRTAVAGSSDRSAHQRFRVGQYQPAALACSALIVVRRPHRRPGASVAARKQHTPPRTPWKLNLTSILKLAKDAHGPQTQAHQIPRPSRGQSPTPIKPEDQKPSQENAQPGANRCHAKNARSRGGSQKEILAGAILDRLEADAKAGARPAAPSAAQ